MPLKSYLETANNETLVIVQIESPKAVENVESIAKVPVSTCLWWVRGLSVLYEYRPIRSPENGSRPGESFQGGKASGINWGTVTFNPDHTRKLLGMGALFLAMVRTS